MHALAQRDHVADGGNVRHRRPIELVHLDVAAFHLHADCFNRQPAVTGPRPVATRRISADSFCVLPSAPCASSSTPFAPADAFVTFVPVRHLMPCLRNDFSSSADTASSSTGTKPRQQLDDRDLAPETAVDRRELHADGTRCP